MKKSHSEIGGDGKWRCACGWKPTARSLGIRRGYGELYAVMLHIAANQGRLCVCGCEEHVHYAGHGACKNEKSYRGPQCECQKFKRKSG
jgi:hypothetical protein